MRLPVSVRGDLDLEIDYTRHLPGGSLTAARPVRQLPIPAKDLQERAMRQLNDLYDFDTKRAAKECLKLARELERLGEESDDKPAEQFVVWRKRVQQWREVVAARMEGWKAIQQALETLKTRPDDPVANLAVRFTAKGRQEGSLRVTINDRSFDLKGQVVDHAQAQYGLVGNGGFAYLDELAVFHRCLSDEEVKLIYDMGTVGQMIPR